MSSQTQSLYVAATIQKYRSLPCPPLTISDSDNDVQYVYGAVAFWSEDAQENFLGPISIPLLDGGSEAGQMSPIENQSIPGKATDMQVGRVQDNVFVVAGCTTGHVCCLQMRWPAGAGAMVQDPPGGPEASSMSHSCLSTSAITSVDINPTAELLLCAAGCGSLQLQPLDSQVGGPAVFKPASPWCSYNAARWMDSHCFVTAGTPGGLSTWDIRQGPKTLGSSSGSWGHTGMRAWDQQQGADRQILCLAAHSSRPGLVASGAEGGGVAVWDLRKNQEPLVVAGGGAVWEVLFDTEDTRQVGGRGALFPPVLFCTADGMLCRASSRDPGAEDEYEGLEASDFAKVDLLAKEWCSINSFDVQRSGSSDIIAVTDYESMLYVHRGGFNA